MTATSRNPAESLVFWTWSLTWCFYLLGALYIIGPVLAWVLCGLTILSLYLGPAIRDDLRASGPIPAVVWAWILGMGLMLVALWVGHLDWRLGLGATIKSTVGWAKGWALLALFPLAGAVLPIRRRVLIGAQGVVALCTLLVLPVLFAAPYLGLPQKIFTSPLKAVGGPGPEYFSLYLYTLDPSSWTPRWQFYAPWSPFAGLLGVVTVLFALEDKRKTWMVVGILAGVAMVLLSKSRMSLVALVVCTLGPRLMGWALQAWAWRLAAAVMASMAVLGAWVLRSGEDAYASFRAQRADSTRVRETLQRIAEERWWHEAPWFGHGTVQPGPHLVEYMPIGSHHTWYGLLFVKGLVGFVALLVPLVWQLALAVIDAARGPRGYLPLGIMLVIVILSFGENIEIEAYLLWPALTLLGIHARECADDRLARAQHD
ncbi:MAG: hypothetical protein RIC87_18275 [Kiloniellales bacterium]